jgi:hypothetical protein
MLIVQLVENIPSIIVSGALEKYFVDNLRISWDNFSDHAALFYV